MATYWWMHAAVLLWTVFAIVPYVIEPTVRHRRLDRAVAEDGLGRNFARMEAVQPLLPGAALITLAGAVGGSQGL